MAFFKSDGFIFVFTLSIGIGTSQKYKILFAKMLSYAIGLQDQFLDGLGRWMGCLSLVLELVIVVLPWPWITWSRTLGNTSALLHGACFKGPRPPKRNWLGERGPQCIERCVRFGPSNSVSLYKPHASTLQIRRQL